MIEKQSRQPKEWNEKKALKLVSQFVYGMSYVHEKGVIHRDLKPRNIFLEFGDRVLIGDFDISGFFNTFFTKELCFSKFDGDTKKNEARNSTFHDSGSNCQP